MIENGAFVCKMRLSGNDDILKKTRNYKSWQFQIDM